MIRRCVSSGEVVLEYVVDLDCTINSSSTTKTPSSDLAHAQTLPLDIVEAIFKHFSNTLRVQSCHWFPWFLGHICSWWRSVFLGMTAQFWSSFGLQLGLSSSLVFKQGLATEIVKFFLRRSPKDPFSFSFMLLHPSGLDAYPPAERACLLSILHMVIEESPRWSKATFVIDESLVPALHRVRNRVPLLEDLVFYPLEGLGKHSISDHTADVFADAPSLTRLSLREILRWKFNWSALTKLNLHVIGDVPNFLAALSQMKKLERLNITLEGYPPDKCFFHPVTLPSLKELSSPGTSIFLVLMAPALQRLSVTRRLTYDFVHNTVTPFFNRSGCKILKLDLSLCPATEVIEIVRDMLHVTHLSLDRTMDLKHNLDWLTQYHERQYPAPHLQSVTIFPSVTPIPVEEVEALQNLIISRSNRINCEDARKLKALTIIDRKTPIERFDKVRKACNDLQVQFHHGEEV